MPQPDTAEPTDDELIERAQAGETEGFDELVRRYSPRLYGLVYNMTSNHEDTNDLLQEIFDKVYRSIGSFRKEAKFYTWVHTIATNRTLNFLKKRNRHYSVSLNDVDADIENDPEFIEITATRDPRHALNLTDLQKKLNAALQKLSDAHRTVVVMFDIQGIPHAQIAKVLNVPEATVRSRLFYAHKQLQAELQEFIKH